MPSNAKLLFSVSQVADGMEIGKEDSDEEKVAALSAVVNVGEAVYVKVVEIKEDDGSGRYSGAWLLNFIIVPLNSCANMSSKSQMSSSF